MLPTNARFAHAALALFAVACFAGFVEAQEKVSIVAADMQPISADLMQVNILFVNRLPTAEGNVTLVFSKKLSLVTEGNGWVCNAEATSCAIPVSILGQQKIGFKFRLNEYFDLDYLDVFFAVGNESIGTRIMLSHIQEPGAITASTLFYIGLISLVVGGIAWLLVLWAIRIPKASQLKFLAVTVRRYLLLFSIMANLFVAVGAALLISPGISIISVVIFSAIFAGGFLVLLNYLPSKAAVPIMSKEDIENERKRLRDMIRITKIKFLERELDDATYNRIIQDCEMQLVKMSAMEKELGS